MFKKIRENLETFFITWCIVIVLNQIFIFHACFAPYCLIAALPHTGIIAGLIVFFMNKDESNSNKSSTENSLNKSNISSDVNKIKELPEIIQALNEISERKNDPNNIIDKIDDNEIDFIDEIKEPYCPKCGSKMVLRTARNGKFSGSKFWGCSQFPKCKSIINL